MVGSVNRRASSTNRPFEKRLEPTFRAGLSNPSRLSENSGGSVDGCREAPPTNTWMNVPREGGGRPPPARVPGWTLDRLASRSGGQRIRPAGQATEIMYSSICGNAQAAEFKKIDNLRVATPQLAISVLCFPLNQPSTTLARYSPPATSTHHRQRRQRPCRSITTGATDSGNADKHNMRRHPVISHHSRHF